MSLLVGTGGGGCWVRGDFERLVNAKARLKLFATVDGVEYCRSNREVLQDLDLSSTYQRVTITTALSMASRKVK